RVRPAAPVDRWIRRVCVRRVSVDAVWSSGAGRVACVVGLLPDAPRRVDPRNDAEPRNGSGARDQHPSDLHANVCCRIGPRGAHRCSVRTHDDDLPLMGTTFVDVAFITVVVGGGTNPLVRALTSSAFLALISTPLSSVL